jgi:hypothetical protein
MFERQTGRQKILNPMVAAIPSVQSPLNFIMDAKTLICFGRSQLSELSQDLLPTFMS